MITYKKQHSFATFRTTAILNLTKDNAPITFANSAVQTCAYELYELRGRVDGLAEQDWYQAEIDLRARQQTNREV